MYIQLGLGLILGLLLFVLIKIVFKLSKNTDSKLLLLLILILCIVLAFSLTHMTSLIITMNNNHSNISANNYIENKDANSNEDEFDQEKDPVKDDFMNYINYEIPKIEDLHNSVCDRYNSITGENYIDDETMLVAIRDSILPTSIDLIENAELIVPSTEEIKNVHEIYMIAIKTQNSALTTIITAIENQDYDKISLANEELDSARKYYDDYITNVNELAKKYNLEFINNLEITNENLKGTAPKEVSIDDFTSEEALEIAYEKSGQPQSGDSFFSVSSDKEYDEDGKAYYIVFLKSKSDIENGGNGVSLTLRVYEDGTILNNYNGSIAEF